MRGRIAFHWGVPRKRRMYSLWNLDLKHLEKEREYIRIPIPKTEYAKYAFRVRRLGGVILYTPSQHFLLLLLLPPNTSPPSPQVSNPHSFSSLLLPCFKRTQHRERERRKRKKINRDQTLESSTGVGCSSSRRDSGDRRGRRARASPSPAIQSDGARVLGGGDPRPVLGVSAAGVAGLERWHRRWPRGARRRRRRRDEPVPVGVVLPEVPGGGRARQPRRREP